MASEVLMRSPRVVVRDWRAADLNAFKRWNTGSPRWQLLDGPYYARPPDAEIEARVAAVAQRVESADWPAPRERLAIADPETDELRGLVSRYWLSQETNWLALGIVIYDPQQWRRGLGAEALRLWCDYLWCELPDLARLDLRTWSGNLGMMRLAEKLGFREEARFRKARVVDGAFHDGLGYGVLREEWGR